MIITFSRNPFIRFYCWLENRIITPIKRNDAVHKKTHYECCVCGIIKSPYFEDCSYTIDTDYGWHKLDNGKYNRWVCHHCADHGFSDSHTELSPGKREYTWDEWQEIVKKHNRYMLKIIKKKDLEYYEYWFNGGYEDERFGNDE